MGKYELEVIRIQHQSISAKLSFNSHSATIAKWSSVEKIILIAFATFTVFFPHKNKDKKYLMQCEKAMRFIYTEFLINQISI